MDLLKHLAADPTITNLAALCRAGGHRVVARGSCGSSTTLVAGALSLAVGRPVLLVVAHLDDADEAADELAGLGASTIRLPALEVLPGETNVSLDLFAQRLSAVRRVLTHREPAHQPRGPVVILTPIQALMQPVPDPARLGLVSLTLTRGQTSAVADVVRWLSNAGYQRTDAVEEPGDFAVRGGILDIFPPGDGSAADSTPPVRLDFFGDTIESIREIDLDSMASDRAIDHVELISAAHDTTAPDPGARPINFLELVPGIERPQGGGAIAMLHETAEVVEQARGYFERITDDRKSGGIFGPPAVLKILQERFDTFIEVNQFSAARAAADTLLDLPVRALPPLAEDAAEAVRELATLAAEHDTLVLCDNDGERQRFGELLSQSNAEASTPQPTPHIDSAVQYLHRGFIWESRSARPLLLLPYHELLHRFHTRRRTRRTGGADSGVRAGRAMDTFLDFEPGDFVVHRDHGICKFVGLSLMAPGANRLSVTQRLREGSPTAKPKRREKDEPVEEFLTLEFSGSARLHVPCTKIDQVQKYVGGFKGTPPLSTLGGERWRKQKDAVTESVKDLASELLRIRAAREHLPGIRYPADTAWQKEFEAEFPYDETEDQLAAIAEIKKDMQDPRPMDRLLCGDVGYGKTELAIRAAFKAVEFGKQVAVLVPTTVLAEQHERTFRARFADYPFRIESLSRFKTGKESNDILAALRKGHVDIIIGTHRILSKDVKFADLGLVVIDEEQRFGVEHKEQLLSLRMTVDVLTLSATPIPRTLHMSMLGLRDISSLATAPVDRRAVVTEVIPYNERRVRQAIARELARGGQIFFVHNRVYNIETMADTVQRLAEPEVQSSRSKSEAAKPPRIVIGHGQMPPHELEQVMLTFMRKDADILVSTTIIESGIDIPTANTMIINDADRFGLADLHQLRGRVGRYKHRAYCYLLLPEDRTISEKAMKRLKAIEEYSMLGAGFKIAMRDLEIRGAGNILGPEQSGHIAAVGYEMYCQLLDMAVRTLKGEVVSAPSETSIELGVTGYIPKTYIASDQRRMGAYRRMALAASPDELARFRSELAQAYGQPPAPTERLLDLADLRVAASSLGARSITVREKDVVARTADPAPLMEKLKTAQGSVRLLPPKPGEELCEVYYRPPENYLDPQTLLRVLRKNIAGIPAGPEPATSPPPSAPSSARSRPAPRTR